MLRGLDEAKALYEWEYAKQLLYTQILRDKIGEVIAGAHTLAEAVDRIAAQENAFFSERFLLGAPLLQRDPSEARVVLLIDEVDRAEPSSRPSCSRCSPTSRSRCPSSARSRPSTSRWCC